MSLFTPGLNQHPCGSGAAHPPQGIALAGRMTRLQIPLNVGWSQIWRSSSTFYKKPQTETNKPKKNPNKNTKPK